MFGAKKYFMIEHSFLPHPVSAYEPVQIPGARLCCTFLSFTVVSLSISCTLD